MSPLEEQAAAVARAWSQKTLEDVRAEAVLAATGIAFDAVRLADGQRIAMVVCVTDMDQIARVVRVLGMELGEDAPDWGALTLAALGILSCERATLIFEPCFDEYKRCSALALIAATPDSIRTLDVIFDFKN